MWPKDAIMIGYCVGRGWGGDQNRMILDEPKNNTETNHNAQIQIPEDESEPEEVKHLSPNHHFRH